MQNLRAWNLCSLAEAAELDDALCIASLSKNASSSGCVSMAATPLFWHAAKTNKANNVAFVVTSFPSFYVFSSSIWMQSSEFRWQWFEFEHYHQTIKYIHIFSNNLARF
jgi:hypothetical protein